MKKQMSSTPSPVEETADKEQADKIAADTLSAVPLSRMPKVLLGRRWWWSTVVVIMGMLILGRLGIWQLDRLQQRRAANAAFAAQYYGEVLDLNGALAEDDPAALADRQAVVNGRFDYAGQIILKEQNFRDNPGVHLVTPFLIEGKEQAILVDRGWIPAAEAAEGDLAQFDEFPDEPLKGVLQRSQTLSGGRETVVEPGQKEWYRIDIEAIETVSAYELFPVYLLQGPTEENGTGFPAREEFELDLSDGPHLGYAVQWFLFAVILAIAYIGYVKSHDKGA
jgi:surfeit locus 1 family protein